jgi:hypothetical protein
MFAPFLISRTAISLPFFAAANVMEGAADACQSAMSILLPAFESALATANSPAPSPLPPNYQKYLGSYTIQLDASDTIMTELMNNPLFVKAMSKKLNQMTAAADVPDVLRDRTPLQNSHNSKNNNKNLHASISKHRAMPNRPPADETVGPVDAPFIIV